MCRVSLTGQVVDDSGLNVAVSIVRMMMMTKGTSSLCVLYVALRGIPPDLSIYTRWDYGIA